MNTENVVEKKYDPVEYQIQTKDGECYEVAELTRDDLMQELCNAIEIIERMDSLAADMTRLINCWRVNIDPDVE